MTPDQHRAAAEDFAAEALDLLRENPAATTPPAVAMLALTHAVLASGPLDLEPVPSAELVSTKPPTPVTPLGLVALVVLAAALVAIVWLLTQ